MAVASFHLAQFPLRRSISRFLVVPAERWEIKDASGCALGKVMGTSKADTTKTSVDIRRWALFAVWESTAHRDAFVETSTLMNRWRANAKEVRSFALEPISSHGSWDGVVPFTDPHEKDNYEGPIAVLTRAKVRWGKVWTFTRAIAPVDDALRKQDQCSLAIGMGEWPFGEQATFSVWSSPAAIRSFAYDSEAHANVIARRASENWYSEELFARFKLSEY